MTATINASINIFGINLDGCKLKIKGRRTINGVKHFIGMSSWDVPVSIPAHLVTITDEQKPKDQDR